MQQLKSPYLLSQVYPLEKSLDKECPIKSKPSLSCSSTLVFGLIAISWQFISLSSFFPAAYVSAQPQSWTNLIRDYKHNGTRPRQEWETIKSGGNGGDLSRPNKHICMSDVAHWWPVFSLCANSQRSQCWASVTLSRYLMLNSDYG